MMVSKCLDRRINYFLACIVADVMRMFKRMLRGLTATPE